jgi:hypothetical protein
MDSSRLESFGATRISYIMSDEREEESNYKPGGTATSALGHWSSRALRSVKDPAGCGCWSYICLGKNDKKFAIVTVYRVRDNRNSGNATASQQQYQTQYENETARVDINTHKKNND